MTLPGRAVVSRGGLTILSNTGVTESGICGDNGASPVHPLPSKCKRRKEHRTILPRQHLKSVSPTRSFTTKRLLGSRGLLYRCGFFNALLIKRVHDADNNG